MTNKVELDEVELQAVQVSYDISAEKTRKREVNGLLLAVKQTGCTNLLLLTDHESTTIEKGGYQIPNGKRRPALDGA